MQSRREESEKALQQSLLDSFQQEYLTLAFNPDFFEREIRAESAHDSSVPSPLNDSDIRDLAVERATRQLQIVLSHAENAFGSSIGKGTLSITERRCPDTGSVISELRIPVCLDSTVSASLMRQLKTFAWLKSGGLEQSTGLAMSDPWKHVCSVQRRSGDIELVFQPSESFVVEEINGVPLTNREQNSRNLYQKWRESVLTEPVFESLSNLKPKNEEGEPVVLRLKSPLESSVRDLVLRLCEQPHFPRCWHGR